MHSTCLLPEVQYLVIESAPIDMARSCRIVQVRIILLLVWSIGMAGWAAAQSSPLPLLTSVDQVRRLTPDKAQLGYPVRIRGVITDDIPRPDFFVQDETAGIYVEGSRSPRISHVFGDFVEVEGITGP